MTDLLKEQTFFGKDPKVVMSADEFISKYSIRTPILGETVIFFPNPDDSVSRSNHATEIPAIITRVWSDICVNLKIVPDCGPMQDRTSVVHVSANPAGYHFMFQDEYANKKAYL